MAGAAVSILAALVNAAVLLIGVGAIGIEAIRRLLGARTNSLRHRHGGRCRRHRGQWRFGAAVHA